MKKIEIEWRHLEVDNNTCVRCADTGNSLETVIEQLNRECECCDIEFKFKETPLAVDRIEESNGIWIDGVAIEALLPGATVGENDCESCCDFTGDEQTQCRTVEFNGVSYEAIPESLIREAACRAADCCQ